MKKTQKKPIKSSIPSPDPLAHISPALRALAVDLKGLTLDAENVRRHGERNLQAIAQSLTHFGQQAPIVYAQKGKRRVVVKGNGLLQAARCLRWKKIAAIPSTLAGDELKGFAIADNRASDLSEFDDALLAAQLQELEENEFPLDAVGFSDEELHQLVETVEKDGSGDDAPADSNAAAAARARKVSELFSVIVECRDEREQLSFYRRMQKEGRKCKLYVL